MYKTLPFSLYMQPKEHLDQLKSPVKHFALVVCLCVALINCNTWRDLNYFKDAIAYIVHYGYVIPHTHMRFRTL